MSWTHYLFSFQGRLNRARYWAFVGLSLIFVLAFVAVFAAAGLLGGVRPSAPASGATAAVLGIFGLVFVVALVVLTYCGLAVTVKRLHDRNRSGWWVLLFSVLPSVLNGIANALNQAAHNPAAGAIFTLIALPFALWGFVEIGCLRGTEGTNRFGPDPLAGPEEAAATFT